MMLWNRSIKNRLILMMLSICVISLSVGMFSVGVSFYQTNKEGVIADSITKARLLANNAVGAVAFEDPDAIMGVLNSTFMDSGSSAAIFDPIGNKLAMRDNNGSNYISEVEYKNVNDHYWGEKHLHVWEVIGDEESFLGVVYLKISLLPFFNKIKTFSLSSVIILIILSIIVYGVAFRLQKNISGRLIELESLSRDVSSSGNYSIRVPSYGQDEIGSLARSFNLMLETIEENQQERDKANEALHLNRRRLERAVKDLQYLANYDSLTQLPNRALCMDRIKYALKSASRTNALVAVLFLDLDHFKDVNDSLGHAVGDQLLKATSQRLLDTLRAEDTLARLGGDEFVIILNNLKNTSNVISLVEKIVTSFELPFKLSSYEINTTVSIGVCMYPEDGMDVDSLMKSADAAMYKAKSAGRNTYEFYQEDLNQIANRRHQIANELRGAVKNNELNLVFQPQLNLPENRIVGAEVLVRWTSPVLGPIGPAEFIPIAESTGLIKEISDWVLEKACQVLSSFLKEGIEIRLAVNLSALQFKQADLAKQIASTLQKYRIPPHCIEVEITESMLMRDVDKAINILEKIKEMNIRIAIDDFGTGYSSLSYLRRFPLDALKIDQSFVDELVVDADDTAITLAIISMAKSLRLEVIAEGVETQQQMDFLKQNNCDDIQGYHFSRPVPEAEFKAFLCEHRKQNAQEQRNLG
jgi:diguanylate cyclase (GGDEF)-like protein